MRLPSNKNNKEITEESKDESVGALEKKQAQILKSMSNPNYIKSVINEIQSETTSNVKKYLVDQSDANNLMAIISEYLTSYIVIGYKHDGGSIILKHTLTDKDEDAIVESIRSVVMSILSSRNAPEQ